ncbi:nucleoprotein [Sandjimba virus]|uniref:Nucleoprotein n=1 Tax=Sandjimba virus TaxID=380432 RepID=A0AAE9BN30_9RHAB|nr:nucleoprotein [Sandjimba virus]UAU42851.1 nucleoprotein [Sandjimba virus]
MTTLYRHGKPVVIELVADKQAPEFPKTFFDKGGQLRLTVPKYSSNLNAAAKAIRAEIEDKTLTLSGIKLFLYQYFSSIKNKLDEDWESFDVKIGSKGDEITPFSFITVEEVDEYKSEKSKDATDDDQKWMAIMLLGLYRVGRVSDPNYKNQIIKAVDNVIKAIDKKAPSLSTIQEYATQAVADVNYCKIVALVDFYFHKFKNDKMAVCRISTVSSRYRDSAALLGLNHLSTIGGGSPLLGVRWALVDAIHTNIDQLIMPGNETNKTDSLMQYMIDLQISKLSPYSTTANPAFHLFVHAAGSFILNPRSLNARMVTAPSTQSIIRNAAFFIMATGKSDDWKTGFTMSDAPEKERLTRRGQIMMATTPQSDNVDEWLAWRNANRDDFEEILTEFMRDRASRIGAVRANTIGSYIKSTFIDLGLNQ